MDKNSGWIDYLYFAIMGGFVVFIVLATYNEYMEKEECYEWGYEPAICSVYKNRYPENCDMVYKLDVDEPCAVYMTGEVVCNEYYMCCNFKEVCIARRIR
jgi:hypothetical protein